jgi:hypothetical protein
MTTTTETTEGAKTTVPGAACRAETTMQVIYRKLWEKTIAASKDEQGHWMVDVASLDAWIERRDLLRKLRQRQ